MDNMFTNLMQILVTSLGVLLFYLFRNLVSEVTELRKEIHSLNEKIAEILASYRVFEVRLKYLENSKSLGGNNEDRKD